MTISSVQDRTKRRWMVVVRDKECSLVPVLKMNSLKVTSSYPSGTKQIPIKRSTAVSVSTKKNGIIT